MNAGLTAAVSSAAVAGPVVEPQPAPAATARAFADAAIARVHDALSAVLAPVGPAVPPEAPLAWVMLGWVRRQFDDLIAGFGTHSAATRSMMGMSAAAVTANAADATDEHAGLPEDLERTALVTGLDEPTDFRFLPDGAILIAEKGGAIKVYQNGALQAQPLVTLDTLNDVERGLGGIVVDPDFTTNHYIYVSYTGADNHERLSRFTVTGYAGNPATDVLGADSEVVLYRVSDEAANYHQGGGLQFGSDDKLYWSLGDNFNFSNSQSLDNPHGKILRLDVDTLNPDGTATVPADNPFVGVQGALPEIYAYGLRNPFRFTFTPTGQMLVADVGGAAWEEINLVTPGANYGWPLAEGTCTGCAFVDPIYAYPHTAPPTVAGAISSILVYTGDALGPEYTNKVFIADYAQKWMKALSFDSQYSSFIDEHMFDAEAGTTVQLLEGPDGKIYQLTIYPGELSVIAPAGGNRTPKAVISATPTNGYSPLTVVFSSTGSTDPEGAPLTYSWDFGDPNSTTDVSTEANPTWSYTTNGTYSVTLTVSDGEKSSQTAQRIVVGSTAPTATILTPVADAPYNAGDTISFSGSGSDAEDGTLPDSAYEWTVEFHHGDHVHPFADNIVGKSGSITIPTDESNVSNTWYRVILTVTDSSGLSTSSHVDVKPRLVNLTFTSTDPEAVYTIDGIPHKGTYTELAVVGVKRVVDVPSPQTTSDGRLAFGEWSDGGAQKHTITTPGADTTYTVVFDDANPHAVPDAFAVIRQLVNNQFDSLQRIGDALTESAAVLAGTVSALPTTLLAVIGAATADPGRIPAILTDWAQETVAGLARAVTPLVGALTDVVAATAIRATGVGAALAANLIPVTLAVLNAPVAVATAVADSVDLWLTYLKAWDGLGMWAAFKYAPELIGGQVNLQTAKVVGAVNDLRDDLLAALSIGLGSRFDGSTVAILQAAGDALDVTLRTAGAGLGNLLTAATSGQSLEAAAVVAWRSVERKAGAGRRSVHEALEEAGEL